MYMGLLHHLILMLNSGFGKFKRGRTSLEDEARSERPVNGTDDEMCNKVRQF